MAPTCATKRQNPKMRTNAIAPLPALYEPVTETPRGARRKRGHLALPRLCEDVCKSFVIGRYWCEPCDLIGTVVREAHTDDVRCPKCGGVAIPASGDEV